MTKICTKCNQEKDLASYSKHKITKDGLRHNCKDCCSVANKCYEEKNPRDRADYHKDYNKKWRSQNPSYSADYKRHRRKNDIEFVITETLRSRLNKVAKGLNRTISTIDLLGCSVSKFKLYIESKFTEGMSWGSYGFYGWHIDHIIPCASFDLTDPEQQRQCFHYTNLQPLWAEDNLSKGDKMPHELSTTKRCHGTASTTTK